MWIPIISFCNIFDSRIFYPFYLLYNFLNTRSKCAYSSTIHRPLYCLNISHSFISNTKYLKTTTINWNKIIPQISIYDKSNWRKNFTTLTCLISNAKELHRTNSRIIIDNAQESLMSWYVIQFWVTMLHVVVFVVVVLFCIIQCPFTV